MDFYTAQDEARRRTRRLVLLFVCAVLALIALTNLVIVIGLWSFDEHLFGTWQYVVEAPAMEGARPPIGPLAYLNWGIFLLVSAVVCTGVGLATLWKHVQLARGGKVVAEMLGGELLAPGGEDAMERRLLNVVAEMALAAALPVPPVYVLPEPAINAFAAGFSSDDAVIGITRGALQQLDRDELQGVIGHEFSHILNGDMRLNMRLLAMLNGILFIAGFGRMLARSSPRRASLQIGSRRGSGGSLALLGVGLLLVGSGGVFFGRMIKAAVSRQREFLADASSVQFTRNPEGLASALQRIGGMSQRGRLEAPRAEEASHLFFAQGVKQGLTRLFATHPPLEERIRRIDPRWNGDFCVPRELPPQDGPVAGFAGPSEMTPGPVVSQAPQPAPIALACHDPLRARDIVLSCLRHAGDPLQFDAHACAEVNEGVYEHVNGLGEVQTLQLLEQAMPALKALDGATLAQFGTEVQAIIREDRRLSLEEMVIVSVLQRHLWRTGSPGRTSRPRYPRLQQVEPAISVLLSALAWGIEERETVARGMLAQAALGLGLDGLRLLPREELRWEMVDAAMSRLRGLFPLLKPRILKAARVMLEGAGPDSAFAAHLLHVIAAAIDCPLE